MTLIATDILAPAAVLILWSMMVLFYMVVTRFKAFGDAGVTLGEAAPGSRYVDVEPNMPAKVNWVSHNYTHLVEQPTIFYAAIAVLAIAGDSSQLTLGLAWGYTAIRIVHSIWQIFINVLTGRVILFTLSTLCLLGLAINAVRATLL